MAIKGNKREQLAGASKRNQQAETSARQTLSSARKPQADRKKKN